MPKRAANGSKRDAGVAAGRFGDGVAGPNLAGAVRGVEDMQGHAILDAAGRVEIFGLGVDRVLVIPPAKMHCEEGGVAHHGIECAKSFGNGSWTVHTLIPGAPVRNASA